MLLISNTRSATRLRLIRGIALFFVIYIAIDLTSLDLCRGEVLEDSGEGLVAVAGSQLTGTSSLFVARIEASDKLRTNVPSWPLSNDDDCFCCCTHVLPGKVTSPIELTDIRSPKISLEYLSVPSPSLARAFHPPRLV